MHKAKRMAAAMFATGLLATATAFPAAAAPQGGPVVTGGLVNVTIVDAVDVNHNTVQLPISVAANVCGVTVAVLSDTDADGMLDCTAVAGSAANH
jgi:ChpA-C